MIMKDEVADLDRIIADYGQYFDKLYVTVTDRPTYLKLQKKFAETKSKPQLVEVSYFKWIDHFGKARLYNQSRVQTDYWMWLDLDDEIEGAENIPQAIEYMEPRRLDVVLFQYDYYRNERDETEALQWRERIIRTNSQLKWVDLACHEYVYAPYGARFEQLAGISIRHRKTAAHIQESTARNRRQLEK